MTYTHYDTPKTATAVAKFARGDFQRSLLQGCETWSAMTVRSSEYRGRYVKSGEALLKRIADAGFRVERIVGPHGRREYRISALAVALAA